MFLCFPYFVWFLYHNFHLLNKRYTIFVVIYFPTQKISNYSKMSKARKKKKKCLVLRKIGKHFRSKREKLLSVTNIFIYILYTLPFFSVTPNKFSMTPTVNSSMVVSPTPSEYTIAEMSVCEDKVIIIICVLYLFEPITFEFFTYLTNSSQ